jgi:hypothetical protein
MEGGVAILLLLIIVVVGGGIAIAMYLTGGAIMFGKDREKRETGERPEHKKVTAPHLEHTDFGRREE